MKIGEAKKTHLFMHEWQIESLHVFDDFIKEGQFYDSTTTRILDFYQARLVLE